MWGGEGEEGRDIFRKRGKRERKEDLLPIGSEEREVLELGVFLLQYFPLVKI